MKKHPEYDNLLQFNNLCNEIGVDHFCTTRQGGVSKGPFSSFNFGNFSDDSSTSINENRLILSRMWFMDISDFIIPHQTHTNKVLVIDDAFINKSISDKIETLYGCDALISDQKNVFLCVTTADCVPILLYDKAKMVVAAIHAGWKGIVTGVIRNTFMKMEQTYNSKSSDIIAAIGPSISHKNYEVGEELISKFKKAGFDISAASYINKDTNKWHIDLKKISSNELEKLGVLSSHIEVSDLCTYEKEDLFFSARRQSIVSGRMLTGIKLKYFA